MADLLHICVNHHSGGSSMSKRIQRSTPLCIALALILLAVPGFGQSIQNGKISGKVLMESGEPIPGVAVTVFSPSLISGNRTTISSENGTFLFMELPIGQYRVEAILDGFKKSVAEKVTVSAAAVSSVSLVLSQGQITEEITVSGTAPVVDARTSTVDTKINKEMMEKLPTSRDAFYDLSLSAPGMADAGKDATWLPSPTAYGSGANENAFLVNGVNATDPRGGGWGTLVNVNYNAVEEVRVVALGAKAEYGSATGVAIDVITKSGSNQLGGSVGYYSQLGTPADNMLKFSENSEDFGRDWLLHPGQGVNIVSKTDKDMEASLTFGGALVKNKVWFYTGLSYTDSKLKKPLFEPLLSTKGPMFDLKLTTEPFKNHRAWVAYHHENTDVMGDTWGDNVPWDAEVQFGRKELNHTISSQWQFFPSQKTFFSMKYLGFWTKWEPQVPEDASTEPAYINWWKWKQFGVGGHFPYVEGHQSSRHTVQADVSQYAENFLGDHDMKFGVQYTTGTSNELGGYFTGKANFAYPMRWTENKAEAIDWYGDTGMQWYVNEIVVPPTLTVRNFEEIGLFFDDQWTIGDRLTINLGLRYDKWRNWYGEGEIYALPARPNDINGDLTVTGKRAGTKDVFNMDSISPRIGLTYSLTNDGKTVVRFNYGRYYMPMGMENLSRFGPNMPSVLTTVKSYSIPWDLVETDADGNILGSSVEEIARTHLRNATPYDQYSYDADRSWTAQVANGTKPQFSDQFTLNLERELIKDFSVSLSYIHKSSGNMLFNFPINRTDGSQWNYQQSVVEIDGQSYNVWGVEQRDYNNDGVYDGADAQWVYDNTTYEVRNMDKWQGKDIKRTYNGFQLVFNKRYSSRWQMMASILYAKSEGIANRLAAQDWNIEGTQIMDRSFITSPNDLVNNLEGPLPFSPDWEIKVNGSYTIPVVELNLGFRYRYNSGRHYWVVKELPRRVSWNEEGIISQSSSLLTNDPNKPNQLPAMNMFDLNIQRSLKFSDKVSLTLSFDCFNLFNAGIVTNAVYNTNSGDIGTITGLTMPRKFKFGLTLEF